MERRIYHLSEVQRMLRPHGALIITSDEEMKAVGDDPGLTLRAFDRSATEAVELLSRYEGAWVDVAYDFFFGGEYREYFPTSPECVRAFKAIHDVARERGVGFGASVLSPLDLGPAYYRQKGRGGRSYQFQEGALGSDGSYSVPLRVQRQWFHNKGPVPLHVRELRAYAFSEKRVGDTFCYAVDPAEILDISPSARLQVDESTATKTTAGYGYVQGVISGHAERTGDRDRVLVVIVYNVEEMDYFHEDALAFLTDTLDQHKAAGISYDSFYSDEMHIQFDWDLRNHFGLTEINTRYITPGLEQLFAQRYGQQYRDLARYLVYFSYAQHGFLPDATAEPEPAQHVFGATDEAIYATWKFRRDYHRLLIDHVVDLFIQAKRYGERIFERPRIWTRAHATWQESPTCDHVDAPWKPAGAPVSRYDYTPAFEWSSSIRENVSACYDYFRWGDFLTGMGNDHPEGGYIDRNYNGAALAASFGAFNDVPYGYWGHWGAPKPVSQRVHDVGAAFGVSGETAHCGFVQDWQHRHTTVLALYPLDLNHVEGRYGSWMVQYGYCDYLTEEKLAEWGEVLPNGHLRVKDREYTTLVALYQPMIQQRTMQLLRQMGERGGTVLWTGPAAVVYREDGSSAEEDFRALFGLDAVHAASRGLDAEDATVRFRGALAGVPEYRVPTHLLPDLVYPVVPGPGAELAGVVALPDHSLGIATVRATTGGGRFAYLGARPRDDQSGSTPDAPRTLYHLLRELGAYPSTERGWAERASNSKDLIVCESPNGAVSLAHHYHQVVETWPGGFFRPEDETFDESVLPPSRLSLKDHNLGPYTLTYEGERMVSFRLSEGNLSAFAGMSTRGITVNGREYLLADRLADLTFAPLPSKQLAEGIARAWILIATPVEGEGDLTVRLPFALPSGTQWAMDPNGNGRGEPSEAPVTVGDGWTELRIPPEKQGTLLYLFA